jgi:queuine tRNA-ribosyltransferase
MVFEITAKDGAARAGTLSLPSGKEIKTPFFMPVMTKGVAKNVTHEMLLAAGTQCGISNSFVLTSKPGVDFIVKAGGLHALTNWKGGYFTDSGGFQMLSKSLFKRIDDEKVTFKNPFSGAQMSLTPEQCMKNQFDIGSDVAMALDHVPAFYGMTRRKMKQHIKRTNEWAVRCKVAHDALNTPVKKQLLFGITQGGIYEDQRIESAKSINDIGFDGVAIGGACFGESDDDLKTALRVSKEHLDEKYPVYVMGMGHPVQLLTAISLGCDCFDSTFPTMSGRHGTLFTRSGNLMIKQSKYNEDLVPIEETCDCYACQNYSRAYIRYLLKLKENVGATLCTIHNIRFMHKLLEDARVAISEGTFQDFYDSFVQSYGKATENVFKYS